MAQAAVNTKSGKRYICLKYLTIGMQVETL